ncbi:MAG: hypothetical protein ACYCTZ_06405 [Candidatus Dormibacteria bacterium]
MFSQSARVWFGFPVGLLAGSAMALAGCSTGAPVPLGSGRSGGTPSPTTPSPSPSSPAPLVFGPADSGMTITISVPKTIQVDLPVNQMGPWSRLLDSNQQVLRPIPGPVAVLIARGAQMGDFQAVRPGTAVISSTLVPACTKDHPPCEVPDRLFTLTVNVSG